MTGVIEGLPEGIRIVRYGQPKNGEVGFIPENNDLVRIDYGNEPYRRYLIVEALPGYEIVSDQIRLGNYCRTTRVIGPLVVQATFHVRLQNDLERLKEILSSEYFPQIPFTMTEMPEAQTPKGSQ